MKILLIQIGKDQLKIYKNNCHIYKGRKTGEGMGVRLRKPGGIIALLDEACMFPKSTHETFSNKLYQNHKRFIKPKLSRTDFTISHYAGKVFFLHLQKRHSNLQNFLQLVLDLRHDEKTVCQKILEKVGLKGYQIGKSKVFLRAGQMAELDARRAQLLSSAAKTIQRHIQTHQACKHYLAL
ncbi:Myosin-9 protein [Spatholobus suberectus]|nr:Myosin-9 protein [Spatholobus suberectus]